MANSHVQGLSLRTRGNHIMTNPIQCPDCVYPGKQRSNSAAGLCSKPAPKDCWGRPMPTLVALQM